MTEKKSRKTETEAKQSLKQTFFAFSCTSGADLCRAVGKTEGSCKVLKRWAGAGSERASASSSIARVSRPPRRVRAVVSLGADAKLIGNIDVAVRVWCSGGVDLVDHVIVGLPSRSTVRTRDHSPTEAAPGFLRGSPHLETLLML